MVGVQASLNSGAEDGIEKPRRFAVLQTGHASPYATEKYGGYGGMFISLLGEPGEEWRVFSVIDGEFPAEEDLEKYDGWVITGSRHDAHGDEEWIEPLCAILRHLNEKRTRTLGVCFGHQVLGRALGGKTGRSTVGWSLGLKEIPLTDQLALKPYAEGLPPVIRILAVHQDQVAVVPPGGELLASSKNTPVEMFTVGDHVLGIQGHPEFTKDVVADLIDKRLVNGIISAEVAEKAHASMETAEIDRAALQNFCKAFLKGKR